MSPWWALKGIWAPLLCRYHQIDGFGGKEYAVVRTDYGGHI